MSLPITEARDYRAASTLRGFVRSTCQTAVLVTPLFHMHTIVLVFACNCGKAYRLPQTSCLTDMLRYGEHLAQSFSANRFKQK